MLAARHFQVINITTTTMIHQNFPFITFTENDSILTMSQQHFGPTSINSATGLHLPLLSVLLAFFHYYCTDISVRSKPTLLGGSVLLYLRYFLCGPLSYHACMCVLIDGLNCRIRHPIPWAIVKYTPCEPYMTYFDRPNQSMLLTRLL